MKLTTLVFDELSNFDLLLLVGGSVAMDLMNQVVMLFKSRYD